MKTRGQIIRAARELKGISQARMAERVKLTQQAYSDIERDVTKNPRREVLQVISKELDIPIETLLLGDEWPGTPSESARVVAREYDKLSPEDKLKVMTFILLAANKDTSKEPTSTLL